MSGFLTVSEVFGPTIQGEGPSLGRRCTFLRLGLCNLNCGAGAGATWECDTPYTWDWRGELGHAYDKETELTQRHVSDIAEDIDTRDASLLVISGGEPLIQQARLVDLLELLDRRYEVEMETNGTIAPRPELVATGIRFNVSPKLAGSGVDRARAWHYGAASALRDAGARFKFVVAEPSDINEVASYAKMAELPPAAVWIMPAGTTAAEVVPAHLPELVEMSVERGYNVTTRLHVLAWGHTRGV